MRKRETVSENEHKVLALIRKYLSENEGDLPYPGSIIGETSFSIRHLNNLVRGLANKKGFVEIIDRRLSLTNKAFEYFSSLSERGKSVRPFSVLPVSIQVSGQVKAGPSETDVLVNYGNVSNKFIAVPDVSPDRKVYAFEVVGDSMEHENIYEGDYVIVEEVDNKKETSVNPNELAVLMYVPLYVVSDDPTLPITEGDYLGPTLKYCREFAEEKYYRLGWKSDLHSKVEKPTTMRAARIRLIGKVIGVYRPFKRDKP